MLIALCIRHGENRGPLIRGRMGGTPHGIAGRVIAFQSVAHANHKTAVKDWGYQRLLE